MPTVIFLTRLREGVEPSEYEDWLRNFDYPTAQSIPSIISYRTHRIVRPFTAADAHYDYFEVVEVTDIDDYKRDLDELPQAQELRRQIVKYLEPSDNYWGHYVE